eukprot:COSAG06_NODE_1073_length_10819_cov_4.311847_5_plen_131_part_00
MVPCLCSTPMCATRDLFALDAMTYAELREQELRPPASRVQGELNQEHFGQQADDSDQYWYQTRNGCKVSVCGSQLRRLREDNIIDDFTIIARRPPGQQKDDVDCQEEREGFSPYSIPLGADQKVRHVAAL